jgi:hypothetical protein
MGFAHRAPWLGAKQCPSPASRPVDANSSICHAHREDLDEVGGAWSACGYTPWHPGNPKDPGDPDGLGLAGAIANVEVTERELAYIEAQEE